MEGWDPCWGTAIVENDMTTLKKMVDEGLKMEEFHICGVEVGCLRWLLLPNSPSGSLLWEWPLTMAELKQWNCYLKLVQAL